MGEDGEFGQCKINREDLNQFLKDQKLQVEAQGSGWLDLKNLEDRIRLSISSQEREDKRKELQFALDPEAYDHLVGVESTQMTLKEQAKLLEQGASIYNSFADEHPIIAEYGTTATLLTVKALVAGPLGIAEHMLAEIRGRAMSSILGMDAVINSGIDQGKKIFIKIDPTLSQDEAHILSSSYILGPLMLLGSAQDIKFATSKIGGKLSVKDKIKIENDFEKTGSLNNFFSKPIDNSGSSSQFGKAYIGFGSKFKFKELEIDVVKGIKEIKIPVTKDAKNSVAIAMHSKYGKFFRDENLGTLDGKKLFWSKDTAKHGGSEYKLYVESRSTNEYNLVANIAPDGKIIQNKHQSNEHRVIKKKILHIKKNEK